MTTIINLPTEIYNIIEDYSNIKINTKWIKTKKELRVKNIKYKCGICGNKSLQFRQMNIFQDKDYLLIMDECKNKDRCRKYTEKNRGHWWNNVEDQKHILDRNRATLFWGYNYQNHLNKMKVIRNLQRLFINIRYHYKEEEGSNHNGYVYNNIYTSKSFYKNDRDTKIDRLVKISKLTDTIRKIEGNGITNTMSWSI